MNIMLWIRTEKSGILDAKTDCYNAIEQQLFTVQIIFFPDSCQIANLKHAMLIKFLDKKWNTLCIGIQYDVTGA
jgi:hypothetical protein